MTEKEKVEEILLTFGLIPQVKMWLEAVQLGEKRYFLSEIPTDLNAIRELELLVIEKVGAKEYLQRLIEACKFTFDEEPYMKSIKMVTADAKTKIAAMIAALEGE